MATSTHTDEYDCVYCGGERTPGGGVRGSFCSNACHYKHKGEKAVNILRHDHRLCASCGRWVKEVSRPDDEWKHERASAVETVLNNGGEYHNVDGVGIALDATAASDTRPTATEQVIGFQYATENATHVEKEYPIDEYRVHYGTGLGCACGMTNTRETDNILRGVELASVLANYVVVFRELEREGQLDQRISKDRFFNTFRETRDIEHAVGKGLHGGR